MIEIAQHTAGCGTVNIEVIPRAAVAGWNHKRLIVHDEADVADKTFVQNLVGGCAVVNAALWLANDTGTGSWAMRLGHSGSWLMKNQQFSRMI